MSDGKDESKSKSASAYAADQAAKEKGEPSLTSTLTILQRTQLIQLLAACTAQQRDFLTDAFLPDATLSPELRKDLQAEGDCKDKAALNPNIDPGKTNVNYYEEQRKALEARKEELKKPETVQLRDDVVQWFDNWRTEMIQRVGQVVKLKKKAKEQLNDDAVKTMTPESNSQHEQKFDAEEAETQSKSTEAGDPDVQLRKVYPPVKTPLSDLPESNRIMILHSMLLILLSLEHYWAPSRVLLLHLCTSLNIPLQALDEDEVKTSTGLIEGAKELSAKGEAEKAAQDNQMSRKWKVGLATAAGAAIIGVTGGLAAPLVAAGVGSVMGGLGLGATAAAGYLGSLAGSTVLVGGLFGAYGGRMTGQMMDNYAKEVSDFAFVPLNDQHAAEQQARHDHESSKGSARPKLTRHESQQKDEAAGKQNAQSRRLRVTIGISGWLTDEEEVTFPWKVLGDSSEAFALRFELEALMSLGHAMSSMVSTAAWGYAKKTVVSSTVLAELASAVAWPIGLIQVARVVDNPFSIAKARADKAGIVLADALINRAQGERPVSLVGYSLGARVIHSCLKTLAERRAFGLVDSAILLGAPVPSTAPDWRAMRSAVAGRLVNVFSENDYVLGFLYRAASAQYGVAGLQRIDGVAGVENADVSETISGHLRYRYVVGSILQQLGWEDLSETGLQHERQALQDMEREQQDKTLKDKGKEAGMMVAGFEKTGQTTADPEEDGKGGAAAGKAGEKSEAEAEQQVQQMEKEVQDKTKTSLLQRGKQYLALYGNRNAVAADEVKSAAGETVKGAGDVKQAGKDVAEQAKEKTKGADGNGQGEESEKADGYSSYLPEMPSLSMPNVSAPSWSSWGGSEDKKDGRNAETDSSTQKAA